MDISIDVADYKLNIRAACLIVHENKMLVHRNTNKNHYAIIGGRQEIGEDSETTVKREIQEEIGKEIEITGYVGTIENFFEMEGKKYHEIMFIHKAEFLNEEDKKITSTIKNIEGKDYLQYEWIDLDKIDEYPLKPKALKEILKEKTLPVHKINKDTYELWDIYDINKKRTGRLAERGKYEFKEGEYHIVVTGIIMNSKNEILLSQRAPHKNFPLMWECASGSILAGETSLEGVLREIREELGIKFSKKEAIFLKEIRRDKKVPDFKDLWLFKKDIDEKEITFPDGEAINFNWVTIEEFIKMYNNKEIIPTINFGVEEYKETLKLMQRESYQYIGKEVNVKIDRPLNSKHPKHGFTYEVNYGFIPNTISGDGEELDCYILGVDNPLDTFEGECIAVIHRTNDDDDKLIVVPKGQQFSNEEIIELTKFQEQYFESEIIT